jgi:peroxiredoxin
MTRRLPTLLLEAMRLLAPYGPAPTLAAPDSATGTVPQGLERRELLKPLQPPVAAPPLRLTDLDGQQHDLASLQGQGVLINFWATWCPPCVEELPALARLTTRMQDQPFRVLTVDVGEQPDEVRAFLADKPINFPVLLDPDGDTFKAWQAYAFPTTMILDRQHRIRYAVFGALQWDSDEVVDTLHRLLAE